MIIGAPLFTVVVVGFSLLEARKVDAYSLAHLVIAVVGKTVMLRPEWTCNACSHFRAASERISKRLVPHLGLIRARSLHLCPSLIDNHPIRRYWTRLTTSAHLQTTTFIFFADGLGQLPKRWSFLAQGCWGWGLGVLLVRGLMEVTGKFGEKSDRDNLEGYSRVEEDVEDDLVRDDRSELIHLACGHCISTTIAISVVTIAPSLVPTYATAIGTFCFVNFKYISLITLTWTVLWFHTYCTSAFPEPIHVEDLTMLSSQTKASEGTSKVQRWVGKALVLLAAAPMVLATFKHGLSGNTMVSLFGELDDLVSSSTSS